MLRALHTIAFESHARIVSFHRVSLPQTTHCSRAFNLAPSFYCLNGVPPLQIHA